MSIPTRSCYQGQGQYHHHHQNSRHSEFHKLKRLAMTSSLQMRKACLQQSYKRDTNFYANKAACRINLNDQEKISLTKEKLQLMTQQNQNQNKTFKSVGKIVKNRSQTKVNGKINERINGNVQGYKQTLEQYESQGSLLMRQVYIGRHKQLSMENRAINQILREKMMNINVEASNSQVLQNRHLNLASHQFNFSKLMNNRFNTAESRYASLEGSQLHPINGNIDQKFESGSGLGVIDKKLFHFQQKYKDMAKQYDEKKRVLNKEIECLRVNNNNNNNSIFLQNNYIKTTQTGKIKQNLKNENEKGQLKSANLVKNNQNSQKYYQKQSKSKSSSKNKQNLELQKKFKQYQEKYNKYEKLSKMSVKQNYPLVQKRIRNNTFIGTCTLNQNQNNCESKKSENPLIIIKVSQPTGLALSSSDQQSGSYGKQNEETETSQAFILTDKDKKISNLTSHDSKNLMSYSSSKKKQSSIMGHDFFELIKKQIQKDQEVRILKHFIKQNERTQLLRMLKDQHKIEDNYLNDELRLSNQEYDPFLIIKQLEISQLANRLISALKISEEFWQKFLAKSLSETKVSEIAEVLGLKDQNEIDLRVFARQINLNLNNQKAFIVRSRDLYRVYTRIIEQTGVKQQKLMTKSIFYKAFTKIKNNYESQSQQK